MGDDGGPIGRTGTGARRRLALAAGLCAVTLLARPAEAGERSRLCPQDAPEGVRLPQRPGCESREERPARGGDGFRDLGNGTQLRIGGRAGVEAGARR